MLQEPAFILAPLQPLSLASTAGAQPPAETQVGGSAAAAGGAASRRTLHCCYACAPSDSLPAVLVTTDECGELQHSQLLTDSPGGAVLSSLTLLRHCSALRQPSDPVSTLSCPYLLPV